MALIRGHKWGMLALAAYLILVGAVPLLGLQLGGINVVIPGLAVAAGVLLLLDR